jgi:hypothetical protein
LLTAHARSTDELRAVRRLLIWSARRTVDAGSAGRAPTAHLTLATWQLALHLSAVHSVLPLLRLALSEVGGVPEDIRGELELRARANDRSTLQFTAELLRILRRLRKAGIEAVPWKGPLLGQRAYGSPNLRMFVDLDVFVRRNDIAAAAAVLREEGFQPMHPMTDRQQRVYVDHHGDLEFERPADGRWLELHWTVVPNYYGRPKSAEERWQRLVEVRLGREVVKALAAEDDIEALCIHGSKHRWERLQWIVDIAMLAKVTPSLEWNVLLARARRHGTLRMVRLGLLLAASVAHAPIPPNVIQEARRDRAAATLHAQVLRRLFRPDHSSLREFVFHARMRERTRDRARYVTGLLYTPNGADWERIDLPAALFPVYGALRPFRLALKLAAVTRAPGQRRR